MFERLRSLHAVDRTVTLIDTTAYDSTVHTYLLTPWCRVFLEKLTGLQLVKKFPSFHGTRRFITALTSVRQPVSILGQPKPVHIPTSHLLEIHPNIIHPSTPRSPQWSLSLRFPHQDPIHPPLRPHTRHMPCPSHSSRFYHPHNIGWGVQSSSLCSDSTVHTDPIVYQIDITLYFTILLWPTKKSASSLRRRNG